MRPRLTGAANSVSNQIIIQEAIATPNTCLRACAKRREKTLFERFLVIVHDEIKVQNMGHVTVIIFC